MAPCPPGPAAVPLVIARLFRAGEPRAPGGVWIQGVSRRRGGGRAHARRRSVAALPPGSPSSLTSTTPAGVGLLVPPARRGPPRAARFPLDLPFSVRRFFDAAAPRLLVLVETELWPVVLRGGGAGAPCPCSS